MSDSTVELRPDGLQKGCEQWIDFVSAVTKKHLIQYDYRHTNGELFSCVRSTLEACWQSRDAWLKMRDFQDWR